jgi:hypothetical protein
MKMEEDLMAEEWQNAGFLVIGGNRPYWTQKVLMCRSFTALHAIAFGFIGYCLGTSQGIAAAALFGILLGLFGAVLGYGLGLAYVYSGRAIATWKLKKFKERNPV